MKSEKRFDMIFGIFAGMIVSVLLVLALCSCKDKPHAEKVSPRLCEVYSEEANGWVEVGYWERLNVIATNERYRLWPRVVSDPNYEYTGDKIKERAVSDGLTSWALCMSGNNPPPNFGKAMIKVGVIIGGLATPENLMEVSKHLGSKE